MIGLKRIAAAAVTVFALVAGPPIFGQDKPAVGLAGSFPPDVLESVLLPPGEWHPYPKAGDEKGWAKVPESVRAAQVRRAEKRLGAEWPDRKSVV